MPREHCSYEVLRCWPFFFNWVFCQITVTLVFLTAASWEQLYTVISFQKLLAVLLIYLLLMTKDFFFQKLTSYFSEIKQQKSYKDFEGWNLDTLKETCIMRERDWRINY